ncbi:Receptor-like protein EIX2 [Euphorbia peplus]|nr:Receptor-like protein EIX2 [Euphorbia peplus]
MINAKKSFFPFLFAAIFLINLRNSGAGCTSSESFALLKLKNGLIDPSKRLQSWDGEADCCSWYGVICNNLTGHVLELHLQSTYLSEEEYYHTDPSGDYQKYLERSTLGGNVSEALQDLKHLQYLDLSNNNFLGNSIPEFLGVFPSLRYLNLSRAGFQGLVPPQLGNLSNLQYLVIQPMDYDYSVHVEELRWVSRLLSLKFLDLNYVNLSAAFDWQHILGKLPSLVELHISGCQLTQIPPIPSISFSSLSVLDLSFNSFYGFPVPGWISNLTSLTYLDLSDNGFSCPIPSLQNLTTLSRLDLSMNGFNSSIPDWLGDLTHLELLDLSKNQLEGEVPSALGNLTSLNFLDISSNLFEYEGGVPTSFKNLCSLRSLSLSGSKLRQEINEVLEILSDCGAHNLESLDLSNSQFSGYLTNRLEKFKNLVHLDLSQNLIFGSIPTILGDMTSLTYLDLSFNKLNGSLPISFGGLAKLESFYVSSNSLEGDVSEIHFKNLTSMKSFDASGNHLSLRVNPNWIPRFPLVETLYLRSCNVGPQFPTWIRHLNRLQYLDLSNSKVSSTLPTWFHNFSSTLYQFNLSHNHMYGMIHNLSNDDSDYSFIDLSSNNFEGPLPYMSSSPGGLDLSHTLFSGSIHNFLCNKMHKHGSMYLSTEVLVLNDNFLLGEIPDCWTYWTDLNVVELSSNNFSSTIPTSIGSLTGLQMLNLHDNNLVGDVPSSLLNCTGLAVLDLGENDLKGEIPSWIERFNASLNILNFRRNKFHGQISKELCSLTYLQILDLADNNLNGTIPACLDNLSGMFDETGYEEGRISWAYGPRLEYMGSSSVVRKGIMVEYSTILNFVRSLDLSNNKFMGEIPKEITSLSGLQSLNLSYNIFTGSIPNDIGAMKKLESLDLSQNRLSGKIPQSMSSMNFLSNLNLSNNNLSGHAGSETGAVDWLYFYVSLAPGFVVGFWCVMGPLVFNKRWRISYFNCLGILGRKIWIWFHVNIAKFGKSLGF